MKKQLHFKKLVHAVLFLAFLGFGQLGFGQTPYVMSAGNYSEQFTNIANTTNWPNNFNGTDSAEWKSVAINASGVVGDGIRTTVGTQIFQTTLSSGGLQRGSGNIVLLSTSTSNASAIDLLLNFNGRNSGTVSFDLATIFNSTGSRSSIIKLFASTDGISFTELTGTNLPYTATNNVTGSANIVNIPLPISFNNSSTAVLRFYEYSTNTGSGSQPKISIDNISVTSTASSTPSLTVASTLNESSLNGATIALTLANDTFANATPTPLSSTNFTLANAPSGVTVSNVVFNSTTSATVTLAYDNTDFDITVSNMTVTIAAAELTAAAALTSNALTVTAVAETIAASPTTLTGLTYALGSGPSASQSFSLSSSNLKLPAGDITVNGTTNYEFSTDNSTFLNSVTVSFTSATLASTPVYVRLKSGLSVGNYNSQTISISGGGATTSVTVSGNVTGVAPANDLCSGAVALTFGITSNGTLVSSTITSPFAKKDVWYKFTPTCTGVHPITVTGFTGDVDVEVFSNTNNCPTTSTFLAEAATSNTTESIATTSFTSGATYYIRVLAFNTIAENSVFTINVTAPTQVTATVTSVGVSAVGSSSATLNGNVTALGVCPGTTTKGFVYALTSVTTSPTIANSSSTVAGLTSGAYSLNLISLVPNSSYTYSAYVYDGSTYTYSNTQTFSTIEAATKLVLVNTPTTGSVGANLSTFTVEAQNSSNVVDINYTGTITINKVSGSGVLSGATASAVSGIATFSSAQFNLVDTYTINASATGLTTSATSGNIVVGLAPSVLVSWNFTGENQLSTSTAEVINSNLSTGGILTRGSGAAASTGANSFRTTGFENDGIAITNTDYFETTLQSNSGYAISLSAIDAKFIGTASFVANPGVSTQFAYSLNGGAYVLIGSPNTTIGNIDMPQVNLSNVAALQNIPSNSTVSFRFYASGQTTTGGFGLNSPTSGSVGLAFTGFVQINSFLWTGTNSNLWSDANNWFGGVVPDGTKDVSITTGNPVLDVDYTVPSGTTLTVSGSGSLTVNPTRTLTVAGSAAFNDRPITFKSDATGTGAFGTVTTPSNVTGATNVTVERYLQGKRSVRFLTPSVTTSGTIFQNWQNNGANTPTIGTHITGSTSGVDGFDATTTGSPSMFTYDANIAGPAASGFVQISNTNDALSTLKAGVGYRILIRGGRTSSILTSPTTDADFTPTTLSSTGSLTVGSVNYSFNNLPTTSPVLINNVNNNTQTNGLTLIGNPYASPVDWHAVGKTGIDGGNAYYTWDPTLGDATSRGRYVVYSETSGTSSVLPSGTDPLPANRRYLQVGQAVFIRNANLNVPATLTFEENDKATQSTNYQYVFRSNESALTSSNSSLYLSVYEPNELAIGGTAIDGAAAVFGTAYVTILDNNDVEKLVASGENVAFVRENKNLAIETVAPVQANDELVVKTIAFQANKNYTFKVNTVNFDSTVTAKMVDMYLNSESPLDVTQPSFVTFSTTADAASYGSDRFKIVFNSTALGNDNFAKNSVAIYPNPIVNNQFTIALPSSVSGKVTVSMSNMLGQEVYNMTSEATPIMQVQPKQQLQEGIYIVSVSSNGTVTQAKVIVKN